MTTEFTSTPDDFSPPAGSDTPVFAPTPAWERGKKRSGSEGEVAAEPRSFAPDASATSPSVADDFTPIDTDRSVMGDVEPTEATFAAAPAYAARTATRKNSAAPIAIAAGIILVGGLATAGWYYTQPHAQGVAELTPGSVSTTTATATTAGAPLPSELAQNAAPAAAPEAAPPAAPPRTMTTTTTTAHKAGPPVTHRTTSTVARARTASPSAADAGADAAARAQAAAPAPMPTPAAPPLVLTLPSASQPAAPTPLPTQTAPATATPPAETPPQ